MGKKIQRLLGTFKKNGDGNCESEFSSPLLKVGNGNCEFLKVGKKIQCLVPHFLKSGEGNCELEFSSPLLKVGKEFVNYPPHL